MQPKREPYVDVGRAAWLHVLQAVGLWVVGSSVLGLVIAMAYGEFGSIVFLFIGVLVGISGAITHALLLRRVAFGSVNPTARALALWIGAMVLPLAWLAFTAVQPGPSASAWSWLIFGGTISLVSLTSAVAMSKWSSRWVT